MRAFGLIILLLFSDPLSAQTVDTWWLPEMREGINYLFPVVHPVPGGAVFMVVGDSGRANEPKEIWRQLSFHFIGQDDVIHSSEISLIGPFQQEGVIKEEGNFEYAVAHTDSGGILLASTHWTYTHSNLGSEFAEAGMLRLQYFWQNGFQTVHEFLSARKPVLLSSANGEAWLAFERVEPIPLPHDTLDWRYRARIVVAHISADKKLTTSWEAGEGYDPVLFERSDGTVLLFFRTAIHSKSLGEVGLVLRALNAQGGADLHFSEERIPNLYYDDLRLKVVESRDQQLTVAFAISDSLLVFQFDSTYKPAFAGKSGWSTLEDIRLHTDQNGDPVLIWRARHSQAPLSWSRLQNGRIFGDIQSIPRSEASWSWESIFGPYDRIALVVLQKGWPDDGFWLYPNVTEHPLPLRRMFRDRPLNASMSDWRIDVDGTLWCCVRSYSPSRMGVYRVRDLSLAVPLPSTLPESAELVGNHPNPFNSTTTIHFKLAKNTPVTLIISDALGREVRRIIDGGTYEAGTHAVRFDAAGLAPGLYFSRLMADGISVQRKLLLQR